MVLASLQYLIIQINNTWIRDPDNNTKKNINRDVIIIIRDLFCVFFFPLPSGPPRRDGTGKKEKGKERESN